MKIDFTYEEVVAAKEFCDEYCYHAFDGIAEVAEMLRMNPDNRNAAAALYVFKCGWINNFGAGYFSMPKTKDVLNSCEGQEMEYGLTILSDEYDSGTETDEYYYIIPDVRRYSADTTEEWRHTEYFDEEGNFLDEEDVFRGYADHDYTTENLDEAFGILPAWDSGEAEKFLSVCI